MSDMRSVSWSTAERVVPDAIDVAPSDSVSLESELELELEQSLSLIHI